MSRNVVPLRGRQPHPRHVAQLVIHELAKESSRVGTTDHAVEKMMERDISARQVREVLKGGEVVRDPTWSDEFGN